VPRPVAADDPGLELHPHERDVLESLNEVIFRTDTEGRLRYLNLAWQRVSGYEVEQSLGHRLSDFLHPDDREAARAHLQAVLAGGLPSCNCELRLQTQGGEVRWIAVAGHRLVDADPEHGGIAGTLDDISTRKVAELTLKNLNHELESRVRARTAELEASNRELEVFSYSVSHDLRAPLRAIDGFTRILEEDLAGRLDDTERQHFARIRKGCERMAELIDALIDLARVARQPLHKESFDFSELAAQMIEELRAEEPARAVDVEITDGLIVTADRQLARVLIENLLRNAWKFSARQPLARIVFRADREDDRRVFCVEDNGAGFDMAYATNLFRPFHRMHSQEDFPGTGIGLATVQRIIQRHEGTIRIESSPGKGTAVHFSLGN
jgi:PAS domain S-box-containing protein